MRSAAPRGGLLAAALLFLAAAPALGQEEGPPADTAAADTLRLPGDTLPGDTLPGTPADTTRPSAREIREGLAGGGFPEKDSVFRSLAEMEGFRAVQYRAKEVVLEVPDRIVRLRDSAQVNYGDAAIRSDSIVYRSRLQFMAARGHIRLVSPEQRELSTDSVLYYDVSNLKGTVFDAQTSFAQGGTTWNVRGDAIPVGQNTLYVETGSFSSCTLEEPHYYFRANQIKMVTQDVIVAWPVVLYISDVPVFWLPFFAQDIRPDRRSGIVPPRFGFNTVVSLQNNPQRQVTGGGFYWAIDRFMDARFTADWYAGRWTELIGDFRYRFLKDFIEGSVRVGREFSHQPNRGDNLRVEFDHEQRLTPTTRFSADGRFVQSEELLRERSFDPTEQTQTIDSNVGIQHNADFASVSLSGRRQQFLGTEGRVDLTLPELNVNFSPVTLFEAPRNRAGPFNNLTWNANANFSRKTRVNDRADDREVLNGSVSQSLSLGRLQISTSGTFDQTEVDRLRFVPPADTASADTAFVTLDPTLRTSATWQTRANFQISLFGNTTLSPGVDLDGGWFRADIPPDTIQGDTLPDTDGRFVQTPTRFSAGANLSTDVFGFFPGFGPFEQIRHKISPRFNWRYRPEVTLSDTSLASIEGFPGGTGSAQNEITISLNQTFEAKVEEETAPEPPPTDTLPATPVDTPGAQPADTLPAGVRADDELVGVAGEPDTLAGGPEPSVTRQGTADRSRAQATSQTERKVTLLAIRSDALRFDFERARMGEPVLTTDRWGNSLTSDLLRGISINLTHDLFEGTGQEREFSPFLAQVNASFNLRSGQGIGDLFGLGGQGRGATTPRRRPSAGFQRDELERRDGNTGGWNLSMGYSLSRSRPGEQGFGTSETSQNLNWNLSLEPTPNWSMRWSTSYNISDQSFGSQSIQLTRDLHRWRAEFDFRQAPSGNFYFSLLVRLTDAPDLKVPYEQSSQ